MLGMYNIRFQITRLECNCFQPVVHLSSVCTLTSHCSEHWVSSKAQEGHNADTSCTYQKPGCSSAQHDCDINTAPSLAMSIWQDAANFTDNAERKKIVKINTTFCTDVNATSHCAWCHLLAKDQNYRFDCSASGVLPTKTGVFYVMGRWIIFCCFYVAAWECVYGTAVYNLPIDYIPDTYIHTYIHTYIYIYIHTYIPWIY